MGKQFLQSTFIFFFLVNSLVLRPAISNYGEIIINESFQLNEEESKTCNFTIQVNRYVKLDATISGEDVRCNSSQDIHYATNESWDNPLNKLKFILKGKNVSWFAIRKTGDHYLEFTRLDNLVSYTNSNVTIVVTRGYTIREREALATNGFLIIYSLFPVLIVVLIRRKEDR
ncbi:MAG: hypothetical protein ACW991_05250 [Candidatus Hodarchaeales archaeon]